uniref:Uncharacterized protein n=1 Tax=Plectus sambesii TaxID=2011161 RepID=A0A914WH72_9BILA
MTTVGRPLPSQSSAAAQRARRVGGADSPTSAASPLAINAISAINTLRFTIVAHATIGHPRVNSGEEKRKARASAVYIYIDRPSYKRQGQKLATKYERVRGREKESSSTLRRR